jgi:hypothetical protein
MIDAYSIDPIYLQHENQNNAPEFRVNFINYKIKKLKKNTYFNLALANTIK